ncbi:MAG: nucleotidyltransferase domain-containing protein [Nitrospira sp.]|nr:nucleotidyltransferase domain-containing protein [Nitrospira sp.]
MGSESRVDHKPDFAEIARRYGIQLVLQFGSTVAGTSHPMSDVDIAVQFDHPDVPLRVLVEVSEELRKLIPDQKIDLAVLNRADPLFLKQIVERCRLLFGRQQDLAQLRMYAFKCYQDYRRFLALERRFVDDRLAAICPGSQESR